MFILSFTHLLVLSNHRALIKFFLKSLLEVMDCILKEPSSTCLFSSSNNSATNTFVAKFSATVNTNVVSNSFVTWYCRLGHAHPNAVKFVLQVCNIPCSNKTSFEFRNACMGKAHRLYAPPSTTIYTTAFDLYTLIFGALLLSLPLVDTLTISHLLMHTHTSLGSIFSKTTLKLSLLSNSFML